MVASYTDQIIEIIKKLAAERDTFTSDDLRPLLPEGATPMSIPAAVGKARRQGLVEEVTRRKSEIPERKGSLVPVLRRPGSEVAMIGTAVAGDASEALGSADDDAVSSMAKELDNLRTHLESRQYVIGLEELATVVLLLAARGWLILSGPSGTGKSSLVRNLCRALDGNFHDIQVKPNWVSSEDSLGYYSEIAKAFIPGGLVEALQSAEGSPSDFNFVRLDEMNLAPPEYYLAEVLSAAEEWSKDKLGRYFSSEIQLPPAPTDADMPAVRVGNNVFLIGTVNVDETTRTLSPKVLDRAAVLDLHRVDLFAAPAPGSAEASEQVRLSLPTISGLLRDRPRSLAETRYAADQLQAVAELLTSLSDSARILNGPVGYRQRDALVSLLALASRHGVNSILTQDAVLDIGLRTSVIPKWQGSTAVSATALKSVLAVLLEVQGSDEASLETFASQVPSSRYPRTCEHLVGMLASYEALGYFSAW